MTMDLYTRCLWVPNELVQNFMGDEAGIYAERSPHGYRFDGRWGRSDPCKGTFIVEDKLNNVLDRGEGKGVVADCQMDVYDIAGRHVAAIHSFHYNEAFGGFGGDKFAPRRFSSPTGSLTALLQNLWWKISRPSTDCVGDTYKTIWTTTCLR